MTETRTISATFLLFTCGLFLAVACAPAGPDLRLYLPRDLATGQISGPLADELSQALKSRARSGEKYLNGQVSFREAVSNEQETVPVKLAAGEPQTVYRADPFTQRLWQVKEAPTQTELQNFTFQRVQGEMLFDWQITDKNGAKIDSGRSAVDLNRTFGGFLAARKVAPAVENPEKLAEEARRLLAEEMTQALALDLGREPLSSEIETAPDAWSRLAASLAASGDWEGARAQWEEALDLNPNFAPALYNLGLYCERQQNPEEALLYYQKAFVANGSPLHRAALTRLTESLMRAGRLAE